jgi:transposase-like protein
MALEATAMASVSCPLCHTVAPAMTGVALAANGEWRCPQCQQNWTANRLATVAGYADYCAKRSA